MNSSRSSGVVVGVVVTLRVFVDAALALFVSLNDPLVDSVSLPLPVHAGAGVNIPKNFTLTYPAADPVNTTFVVVFSPLALAFGVSLRYTVVYKGSAKYPTATLQLYTPDSSGQLSNGPLDVFVEISTLDPLVKFVASTSSTPLPVVGYPTTGLIWKRSSISPLHVPLL